EHVTLRLDRPVWQNCRDTETLGERAHPVGGRIADDHGCSAFGKQLRKEPAHTADALNEDDATLQPVRSERMREAGADSVQHAHRRVRPRTAGPTRGRTAAEDVRG